MTRETADDVLEAESRRVVLEALIAAYQDIHSVLDDDEPTAERLSATHSKLAVALRALGSNGGDALNA